MCRKMKDSGIEWIGEIPEEWKIIKVKQLFTIGRGRVIAQTELDDNGNYPVYSSQTQNNGCLGYINTYDFNKSQLTWTTDGANAGTVFLREGKYNCTNVCGTLLLKTNDNLKYLKYDLEYIAVYYKRQDTNGYKIMNNEMAEIKIVLPSLKEQNDIVTYLDSKCTRIDETIEKQKQVIEKLKEYRESVITEAVTKGLNLDVPMKDSGIEWIGEIPEHWRKAKLKIFSYIRYGLGEPPKLSDDGLPIIRATNINHGKVFEKDLIKARSEDVPKGKNVILKERDIIVVRSGAYAGDIGYISKKWQGSLAGYDILMTLNNINSKYVAYQMLSDSVLKNQLLLSRERSAQPHLNAEEIGNIILIIPNDEEQELIVKYLDKKCFKIDNAITQKETLIDKLTEYKKSLIYECVTGKKEIK